MSESHAAPLVPDSSPPTPWSNNIDSGKSTIYGEISVPDPYVEGNLPEPEFATRQAYFTREYLDQSPNLTRLEDTVNCCNGYAKFYSRDGGKQDAQTNHPTISLGNMGSDRNDPVYHETHLPATLQYYIISDALTFRGATQINNSQDSPGYWLPPTSAEIGYTGPLHLSAEYNADGESLVPGQPSFVRLSDDYEALQQNNLWAPELEPVPISYEQLQRRFAEFLLANLPLLRNVTNSTPDSMVQVQLAFEVDLQRDGPLPPFAEVNNIFRQFEPVIGTSANRKESVSRRTKTHKLNNCPFHWCGGQFTRPPGLHNHLYAHFGLAPNECPHCRKRYSDVAFHRHMDSCRKAARHFTV